jgi:hypothetical protein
MLSLFVVNHSLGALERTLDVSELSRSDELVEVYQVLDTLDAGQRDTLNSWREPDRIRTVRQTLAVQGQRWTQRFAPLSVTCLKIRCRAQP